MSIFDEIKTGTQLELAVIQTLATWMPTYLEEMRLQLSREDKFPSPRTYTNRNSFEKFMEDQLPLVIVVSPGLVSRPTAEGSGRFRAKWQLGTGIIASARNQAESNDLSKVYIAAARAILLQKSSLGGVSSGMEWVDESYDEITEDVDRSMAAGMALFEVEMESVINRWAGPAVPNPPDPDDLPGSDWYIAEKVIVTIIRKEEQE
jgi:hypothetical protein